MPKFVPDSVTAALEASYQANPSQLLQPLIDAYCERGLALATATRKARLFVRQAREEQALEHWQAVVATPASKVGRMIRAEAKNACRLPRSSRPATWLVIPGDADPSSDGEGPYHTFRNSPERVRNPKAALKAGYKIDYHPSTLRVLVSIEWCQATLDAERDAATNPIDAEGIDPDYRADFARHQE